MTHNVSFISNLFLLYIEVLPKILRGPFRSNDYHGTRYNAHLDVCESLGCRCMDFRQSIANIHCNVQDHLENI